MNKPTDKKIKLSPKQKEVIRLMREGYFFKIQTNFGKSICFLQNEGLTSLRLRNNVFKNLIQFEIIERQEKDEDNNSVYILTELGKTIDIS
jgi:hypothetical protein